MKMQIVILTVGMLALVAIGCSGMLDRVTPAEHEKHSLAYLAADANEFVWPSLHTARQIRNDIIIKHRTKQIDFLRLAADDKLAYTDAIGFINQSIAESQALQDLIVGGPDQPISILGILAGAGIAFPVGKILKRKGDYSPSEYDAGVAKAKNGNAVDV